MASMFPLDLPGPQLTLLDSISTTCAWTVDFLPRLRAEDMPWNCRYR